VSARLLELAEVAEQSYINLPGYLIIMAVLVADIQTVLESPLETRRPVALMNETCSGEARRTAAS
jgi:hypothetical protein